MSVTINRDEWLSALEAAGMSQEDDQQAITVHEFAAMFDLRRFTAERKLAELVKTGKAIRTLKLTTSPSGRRMRYVAYRLLEPKAGRKAPRSGRAK